MPTFFLLCEVDLDVAYISWGKCRMNLALLLFTTYIYNDSLDRVLIKIPMVNESGAFVHLLTRPNLVF